MSMKTRSGVSVEAAACRIEEPSCAPSERGASAHREAQSTLEGGFVKKTSVSKTWKNTNKSTCSPAVGG
jgi:hypothetical protein